ncbi:MAG: Yip1 family protein [Pseudomonadota bacterium]
MNLTIVNLLNLAGETLRAPRQGARQVLNLGLTPAVLWQLVILVVVLGVLLGWLTLAFLVPQTQGSPFSLFRSPLALGIVQGSILVLMIFGTYWIGRAFGGAGDFEGTMAVMVWLQVILLMVQLVQTIAFLLVPPLGALIGYLALVMTIWLFVNFVAELHGFESLGMVFLGTGGVFLGIVLAIVPVLSLIGVGAPPGG